MSYNQIYIQNKKGFTVDALSVAPNIKFMKYEVSFKLVG